MLEGVAAMEEGATKAAMFTWLGVMEVHHPSCTILQDPLPLGILCTLLHPLTSDQFILLFIIPSAGTTEMDMAMAAVVVVGVEEGEVAVAAIVVVTGGDIEDRVPCRN